MPKPKKSKKPFDFNKCLDEYPSREVMAEHIKQAFGYGDAVLAKKTLRGIKHLWARINREDIQAHLKRFENKNIYWGAKRPY